MTGLVSSTTIPLICSTNLGGCDELLDPLGGVSMARTLIQSFDKDSDKNSDNDWVERIILTYDG